MDDNGKEEKQGMKQDGKQDTENDRKAASKEKKASARGSKSAKKSRNPNIRLVKNGDLPIEEKEKPAKKTKTSAKKTKKSTKEVKSSAKETKKPMEEVKPPAKETKKSAEEIKLSVKKVKKPTEEVKSSAEETKKPTEEVKPSAEEMKKPAEEVKSSAKEMKKPTEKGKSSAKKGKKPAEKGKSSARNGKKPAGKGKSSARNGKKPTEKTKSSAKNVKKSSKPIKKKANPKRKAGGGRDKEAYQDKLDIREWFVQHKSLVIIGFMIFAFCSLLIGTIRYIATAYKVTTVYVDGNVHYTNEEIMDMVMEGRYGSNSLFLSIKYKDKGIEGVPFVEKMDVHILTPNTIRISVYEKALAGYVEYLGRYMYFDRDGIVVESSERRTSGIPQVIGLEFDYVVLNELLPVENNEIFNRILDITQLLNKYELTADKIFFDSAYNLTLFFDNVRVTLGSNADIDHKIIRLRNILPELEGKKGTLKMENYTEDTKSITFRQE